MFFAQASESELTPEPGVEIVHSKEHYDTMWIENAISRGAREVHVFCSDVERSWIHFKQQFHFVQAAGGVVINDQDQLLFIFRHGKWDLPKGKVEEGEQVEEGALREVEEECSIDQLVLKELLTVTWHTYIQSGEPTLKATAWYRMNYSGRNIPQPQIIEGITETRWFDLSDLAEVEANTYASVLDVIEAYRNTQATKK